MEIAVSLTLGPDAGGRADAPLLAAVEGACWAVASTLAAARRSRFASLAAFLSFLTGGASFDRGGGAAAASDMMAMVVEVR